MICMKAYINKFKGSCKKIFQSYVFIGILISSCVYLPALVYNDYSHKLKIEEMINNTEVILIARDNQFKDAHFEKEKEINKMSFIIESQRMALMRAQEIINGLVNELNKLRNPKSRSEA